MPKIEGLPLNCLWFRVRKHEGGGATFVLITNLLFAGAGSAKRVLIFYSERRRPLG